MDDSPVGKWTKDNSPAKEHKASDKGTSDDVCETMHTKVEAGKTDEESGRESKREGCGKGQGGIGKGMEDVVVVDDKRWYNDSVYTVCTDHSVFVCSKFQAAVNRRGRRTGQTEVILEDISCVDAKSTQDHNMASYKASSIPEEAGEKEEVHLVSSKPGN